MKPRLKLRFLVSTLAVLMLSLAALPALAVSGPGAIDPAFNGGIPAIIDSNPNASLDPYAAAMNPLNGDILWAGHYYQNSTNQSGGAIFAYKPDGSLDTAVNGNGEILLDPAQAGSAFAGGRLYLYAIAVDGQGRILAAGYVYDAGGPIWAMVLARFKPDGTLDTAFGAAGTGIVVAPLNSNAEGDGLSLTADGHILVTGEAFDGGTAYPLTVWRFKPDGTADTAFGSNGHVQIAAINAANGCFISALQPDGALIAGCPTATSWKLTRLKADGTVDTGFGSNGYVQIAANQELTGLALAPDGGFVISELDDTTAPPFPLDMRRFLAAGTVDTNFNGGSPLGIGTVPSGTWQVPVAVQPDGKILISYNDGGTGLLILRFLADGAVDSSFGFSSPGGTDIDFTGIGGYDYTPNATALLLQGDGKIVASGWAGSTAGLGEAAFVTRVLNDTYDLTPTAPAFTAVARAPLGQALASNAVTVGGETIGGGSSGVNVALVTQNGKYSISGAPFTGSFTATNVAWAPAEGSLALEQMTPTTGGTTTTTTVVLGGFWAANNYAVPLGGVTANWTTTTDQPPVASDATLTATTAKATTGTLTATNPSSGTLAFAIVTPPAHGTATLTNAATGAYSYTSASGYTGSDSFTWKVNDGVADSNTATVNVTVKKAPPPPSGGGGGFGPLALLGLLFLALVPWWLRRRGFRSTPTQSTQSTEDLPMKLHLKLRLLISTLAMLMLGLAALPAPAASGPGYIDTTFNGGTPVILDLTPSSTFQPYAAAMNPLNGDILWAGHYQTPVDLGGAINVYKPDGTLDPAVGGGSGEIGLTADQAGFTGGNLYLYTIAVDGQGRILVAGMVVDSYGTPAMILVRFKPDGTLDTTFGTAGTGIVVAPLNTWAIGTGLSLTADGHILVTGEAADAGVTQTQLTVWRFKPDGTADTAFGSNGHVQIAAVNDPADETCLPALQPDGALIAGCQPGSAGTWKLTRLQADGSVDTGFGTSGYLTGAANRALTGLALAPDGGFVISELDTTASPYPLDMRRFLAGGTVDTGFNGGSPLLISNVPNGVDQVPVAVQPDGKILISNNDGGYGLFIGRFLANGTLDSGFGNSVIPGLSDIPFTSISGYNYTPNATALLLQGDGRIVASGWADSTAGGGEAAFVTRVLSDTYDLTPTAPAFNDVARAPLGQALASNAVTVGGETIGGATSGVNVALITQNGKYSISGAPFAGDFTATNTAWAPAEGSLALEQMTPTTGGTATTTTVVLGGFWAANNYEVPLGSPPTAFWKTTTDQPPVASDATLSAKTGKATAGTLTATNPSGGTLAFAIVVPPAHGTATLTNAVTGAYTYSSTGGYTGADSFTWKVNDGVADSNTATVSVTVKKAPPSGGGGGGFGPLALLGLLFLALVPWWLRRRGFRSTPTQPTEGTAMKPRRAHDSIGLNLQNTQLREDIPMKPHVKLRFLVSTLAALALSLAALPALAASGPGTVDPAFNGGTPAIVTLNSPNNYTDPYAAAMNPLNSDILWAGNYQDSTGIGSGAIVAYTPGGSLDTGFGGGAILLTADQAGSNFTGGSLYLLAIAVDGQGRILAAGYVIDAGFTTTAMVLARFKPDGTLDTGFGTAGTGIVVDPLNAGAEGTGLSLTADGHILVTGDANNTGNTAYPLTVWRFKSDGTADTVFGNGHGYVQIAAINNPFVGGCWPALQPDGALIAGCSITGSWKLTRLKADGTVDTGFGTSGYLTGTANWSLAGLALAPDGGFVISELDTTTSPYPLNMRRFLADGTVDPGFNGGSPLDLGTVPSGTGQVPVAVQPDGKILTSANAGGSGNSLALVRFLANGTLDAGFGNVSPGMSLIDFSNINGHSYTPNATALLLQGDGKIVASGWVDSTAGSKDAGFATRVLSDAYNLTPTTPAFNDVAHAPLGQALASNAVTVSGVSIGSATSGFSLALVTQNGKYSTSGGASFAGTFTGINLAWAPAGSQLALDQMTPTTGGTDTTTTVILGGFWAANNYEVPLGSPAMANWTSTTDQPPVASDGTLIATTAKATTGTLTATNPSSGTLAFAIVTAPAHGTVTVTAATGAYSYTSTAGYTGSDSFTWKVNDGVADSNIATVNVTVKKAPPSGGGGGGFGPLALLGLLLLGLGALLRRPRVTS